MDDDWDSLPRAEQVRREIDEIYQVLRRQNPAESKLQLWTEAQTLWRVRLETEVLLPPDEDEC